MHFLLSFRVKLNVESDSRNAIAWISSSGLPHRIFQFLFNEIKSLSSLIDVVLIHVGWQANGFVDTLAKKEWMDFLHRLFLFCYLFFLSLEES